jgi:hypothetical protein
MMKYPTILKMSQGFPRSLERTGFDGKRIKKNPFLPP